jgi:RHS repeat-associated protein
MSCPPRGTVPVNTRAWFREFVSSQHTRFAFGNGCDHPSYVPASFQNHFPVGNVIDSAVLPHLVRRGISFLILFASLLAATGNVTRFGYDPNCGCSGRQASITNALGQVTLRSYDANANESALTDALGRTTTFLYDELDRRTYTIFADGSWSLTSYDAIGRRIAETDQSTNTTWFGYDGLGRLTAVTNALGHVTRYAYDEVGSLIAQTDANNHTTTYEYHAMGRRVKRTLPGLQVETYAYDRAGNLTNKVDFNGRTTLYAFDALNRLTNKTPDTFFAAPPVAFTYTATGQRMTMSDVSGTTTYDYDLRDRLRMKATPQGTLIYSNDVAGNVTFIGSLNANGVALAYTYDALNRLETATDTHTGPTTYGYDAVGNLQGYVYPNDVASTYTYDALNRLTNLATLNPQLSTVASYAYTLKPTGHRASVAELSGRAVAYSYDNTHRLTTETVSGAPDSGSASYTLDDVGNRLTRTSTLPGVEGQSLTYDPNDRLATDTYDANGNTTVGHIVQSAPTVSDAYDFEDRLINRNNGQVTVVYDGDGNRVSKTVGGVTTLFLVDDRNPTGYAQVLEELSTLNDQPSTPVVTRVYAYGHDLISQDQLLADGQGGFAWVASFFGYDGHGNVRFLTDQNGDVTDTYDYDAFGTRIAQTGSTPNSYLYCGEQFDADLGLYYNRARYLNADSGRFWTRDVFEGLSQDPSSLHKYLYAHADPINGSDPSGFFVGGLGDLMISVKHMGNQQKQEAQKARRNYNLARRGLCNGGAQGLTHMHHALPWFLGGKDKDSNLIPIPGEEHMKFHRMLHWALKMAMMPGTASDAVYEDLFKGKDGKLERKLVHQIVLAVSKEFDKRCKKHLGYEITPKVQQQIDNKEWDF